MKKVYAFLLLCGAVQSSTAQSVAPVTHMEGASPELVSALRVAPFEPLAPRTSFIVAAPAPVKPRTFNHTFAILALVSAAMTVADVELTANSLKTVANSREANPLLGSNPSRARLYGVSVPIYAGEIALGHLLRRRFPERKSWMRPFVSLTGAHAVGVVSNLRAR